jgi:hypothetical protein
MMIDNERCIIGLQLDKKNINYYYSSHKSNQPQLKLSSFNYQIKLAKIKSA